MANIKKKKKRILVTKTKRNNNVPKKSSMKTAVKAAVANPNKGTVNEAYKRIDKALAKNIITKNKAAREKAKVASKLSK